MTTQELKQELKEDFTMIKKGTKMYEHMIELNNLDIKGQDLYEIYGRYSYKKVHALNYCIKLAQKYSATTQGILSHTRYFFTYGFGFELDNKKYFAYITKSYNRLIELD